MKKYLAILVIILSLAIIRQVEAADQTADFKKTITGSGQVTGVCGLLAINIRGVTAGDNIGVYDYNPDAKHGTDIVVGDIRDLEFELGISVNGASAYVDAKSVAFSGVYIQASAATIFTTVLFDY